MSDKVKKVIKITVISIVAFIVFCFALVGIFKVTTGGILDEYYKNGYIYIDNPEHFVAVLNGEIMDPKRTENGYVKVAHDTLIGVDGVKGFRLACDIDLAGVELSNPLLDYVKRDVDPIDEYEGNIVGGFSGSLDGRGYAVKNISMSGDCSSLFGVLAPEAEITNLTIKDSTFTGGKYISAFVSYVDGVGTADSNVGGTISNCVVENCIIGGEESTYVGAFVGAGETNFYFTLENCTVKNSTIKGYSDVGGIYGWHHALYEDDDDDTKQTFKGLVNENSSVTAYKTNSDSNYDANVGGVFGRITNNCKKIILDSCKNSGEVRSDGNYRVGGIVGNVHFKAHILTVAVGNELHILNSENTGSIHGKMYVGGIVGNMGNNYDAMKFTDCKNSGTVESYNDYAGGIVGYIDNDSDKAVFTRCKNLASAGSAIIGQRYVGGICGRYGKYVSCENTMDILYGHSQSSSDYYCIGGIVGETLCSVENCINTGKIDFKIATQADSDTHFSYNIGGIAGKADRVTNSSNTGIVRGVKAVGGIIGYTNSQNVAFSGNSSTGHIIGSGYSASVIDNTDCTGKYAIGIGALIGMINNHSDDHTFTNCSVGGTLEVEDQYYGVGGLVGLFVKTTSSTFADEISISSTTINFILDHNGNPCEYGAAFGACGTINNDTDIDLDAENAVMQTVNSAYTVTLQG